MLSVPLTKSFLSGTATSLAFILAFPIGVSSFGTIAHLGQHKEHEFITKAALACSATFKDKDCFETDSINQLAGSDNDYGAVGSPDVLPPQGLFFDDGEHCDNADFLDYQFAPDYPQSREKATEALQKCIKHMKDEINGGVRSAKALLNDKGQISTYETSSTAIDCQFRPSVDIANQFLGRAKCNVLQGFGYALHGIQDFYSHSNYGDARNDQEQISIFNPPGLGNTEEAKFLDLRTWTGLPLESFISPWLSTGCFNVLELVNGESGLLGCENRITHSSLNKDEGDITEDGTATNPTTPRGKKADNFNSAVQLAIKDTRRQWRDFQDRLRDEYGAKKANLMICAVTKDEPKKSCQGRHIAIAVDSSGSNLWTDPGNLRIAAAQSFNSRLVSNNDVDADGLPDLVTVIDFDGAARVVYPLGDPSQATFDGIDSLGATSIASGISLSIDELSDKAPQGELKDRTGILVLTDGDDPDPAAVRAQLDRAYGLGIRVNWGFLSPSLPPIFPRSQILDEELNDDLELRSGKLAKRAPAIDLLSLILKTGGTYSTIDSAEAQENFVDLVISNGPTNIDNAGSAGTEILPGLTIAKLISSASGKVRLVYKAAQGENLHFTITALSNQVLSATLHDVPNLEDLDSKVTDQFGTVVITLQAKSNVELELFVTTDAAGEGVFTVGLASSAPIRDPTTTTSASLSTTLISSTSVPSNTTVLASSTTASLKPSVSLNHTSTKIPASRTLVRSGTGSYYNTKIFSLTTAPSHSHVQSNTTAKINTVSTTPLRSGTGSYHNTTRLSRTSTRWITKTHSSRTKPLSRTTSSPKHLSNTKETQNNSIRSATQHAHPSNTEHDLASVTFISNYVTKCPVTHTRVSSGRTSYLITHTLSTIRLTKTSAIPCHNCHDHTSASFPAESKSNHVVSTLSNKFHPSATAHTPFASSSSITGAFHTPSTHQTHSAFPLPSTSLPTYSNISITQGGSASATAASSVLTNPSWRTGHVHATLN